MVNHPFKTPNARLNLAMSHRQARVASVPIPNPTLPPPRQPPSIRTLPRRPARRERRIAESCLGERDARDLPPNYGWGKHVDSGAGAGCHEPRLPRGRRVLGRRGVPHVGGTRRSVADLPHERRRQELAAAVHEQKSQGILRFDGVLGSDAWSRARRSDRRRHGETHVRSSYDGRWAKLADRFFGTVAAGHRRRGIICGVEYMPRDFARWTGWQHMVCHRGKSSASISLGRSRAELGRFSIRRSCTGQSQRGSFRSRSATRCMA